jgi:hypothetical protein
MRENFDRNEPTKIDLRTLTLTLTVSLFIAMLAFFMILNSYASKSEEKVKQARNSITASFGLIGQGLAREDTASKGSGTAGDMEVATSASLRSVLPDVGFQSHNGSQGHVMSVTVKRSDFEERWGELQYRLADLMTTNNIDDKYRLQLIALDGPNRAPDLASLAANLEEAGIDAKMISIGFEERGRDAVELRFVASGG